ncbi:MAG: thioredoxin-dependent thiol peroxidase [Bacteroidia bacterium]
MVAKNKEPFRNHTTSLKEGMKAPDFKIRDEQGREQSLKDYKGKKLVLYFYPSDGTPTCTEEACNLRDHIGELKKQGYEVIGVSQDDERSHQKFITKHKLPFSLLADTELELARSYDTWGKKQFMGRIFDGIARTTFLISEKGIIEKVIAKVKAKEHAAQVLASEM